MRKVPVLLAVCAIAFASCGKDEAKTVAKPKLQSVAVQAKNYSFAAPGTVSSGALSITLTNAGTEPHQAQLMKLKTGATPGKLVQAAKGENEAALLALVSPAGGPNGIDPGTSQTATVTLQPGKYAFVCLIPDAKGRSHLSLGMVSALEVTKADEEASLPAAEYPTSAREFKFALPTSWDGPIGFTNKGLQPHEFQVLGIAKGKTEADFKKAFSGPPAGGESGPPPFTALGGGAVIAPGGTETFTLSLKPGTYYAMCFVTDPKSKAPHFSLGMMQRFEVKDGA